MVLILDTSLFLGPSSRRVSPSYHSHYLPTPHSLAANKKKQKLLDLNAVLHVLRREKKADGGKAKKRPSIVR